MPRQPGNDKAKTVQSASDAAQQRTAFLALAEQFIGATESNRLFDQLVDVLHHARGARSTCFDTLAQMAQLIDQATADRVPRDVTLRLIEHAALDFAGRPSSQSDPP